MSPESNVTFDLDHSHVMHVHVRRSVYFCLFSLIAFQARDSPKTYSTGMYGSSTLSFSYYTLGSSL